MRIPEITKTLQIPEDVKVKIERRNVTVEGEKGTLTRDFSFAPIFIKTDGNLIRVWAEWPRKKEISLVGTIYSHIQNMIKGARKGFSYKLKIVFSHFPVSVKVQGKTVLIENFTGERSARKAKILGEVQVKVQSDDVIVQGINLEDVSQTAANIEQATKIRKKDPRVFLDGIYVFEKNEGMN
ncbi:50S ribosomal protein L6 [Candidatus Bathyarchaeota archaeon]|nr:50S ribosomal protein L6 [Candidatus Bathyarchaeota archaeon]